MPSSWAAIKHSLQQIAGYHPHGLMDDAATLQVWDLRVKRSVQTFEGKYQVLAVAFAEAGDQVRLLGGPCERLCSSHMKPGEVIWPLPDLLAAWAGALT